MSVLILHKWWMHWWGGTVGQSTTPGAPVLRSLSIASSCRWSASGGMRDVCYWLKVASHITCMHFYEYHLFNRPLDSNTHMLLKFLSSDKFIQWVVFSGRLGATPFDRAESHLFGLPVRMFKWRKRGLHHLIKATHCHYHHCCTSSYPFALNSIFNEDLSRCWSFGISNSSKCSLSQTVNSIVS